MEDTQPLAEWRRSEAHAGRFICASFESDVDLFDTRGQFNGLYKLARVGGYPRLWRKQTLGMLLRKLKHDIGAGKVGVLSFQPQGEMGNQPVEQAAGEPKRDDGSVGARSCQTEPVFAVNELGSEAL